MKENTHKKWNEIKTNDSWSILKIMGEFVEGYEKLGFIGPCISILDLLGLRQIINIIN